MNAATSVLLISLAFKECNVAKTVGGIMRMYINMTRVAGCHGDPGPLHVFNGQGILRGLA